MRMLVAAALSLVLATPSLAGIRLNHGSDDRTVTLDDRGAGPLDCGALRVQFGGKAAAVEEQRLNLSSGELKIEVQEHGGIYVQHGGGSGYTARLCKAASDPALLADVRLVEEGRSLTVHGPREEKRWVGYLIVDAPTDASLRVESQNAPITLKRVRGSFVAKAHNGPISIEDAAGTIDAATQNGPIALSGSEGDVKLRAQNGPIAVELGREWRGKGLDARTQNGPLAVTVGSGFRSGVVVESEGHSPWDCDGPSCAGWHIDDTSRGHTFKLGEGEAAVRLATSNGPVAIQSPEL
ncbi:MAG TPA: hypothetical protein VFV75_18400 [Candidatus Polarisedimenticolaceae bacterium]|nr:hypothetical protein [Candidatus Polarisedimenticolaceae bacterium]